jgi:hypothetical protein
VRSRRREESRLGAGVAGPAFSIAAAVADVDVAALQPSGVA